MTCDFAGPTSPPAHAHGEIDPGKEYKIKSILDENKKEYKIDWEDDEVTGEHYEPTWEPKANANKQAVADWQRQRAEKLRRPSPSTSTPKRKSGRPTRVILSSPDTSPELPRKPLSQLSQKPPLQANGELAPELEIVESQPDPVFGPEEADSPLFEPAVEPSDPPSSFQVGADQKFSSAENSSAPVVSDHQPESTHSGEQSRSVPVNFAGASSRVVPDSQSAVEFSSSAPAATTSDEAPQASSVGAEAHIASHGESPVEVPGEEANERAASPPPHPSLGAHVRHGSASFTSAQAQSAVESSSHPAAVTANEGASRQLSAASGSPIASQRADLPPIVLGEKANEQASPGPATQPLLETPLAQESTALITFQSETQESAESSAPAPKEAVVERTAVPAVTGRAAGQSLAQAEALSPSKQSNASGEVSDHSRAATPIPDRVRSEHSNGAASRLTTPERSQTLHSLASSFPFQTQIVRPSASNLRSPLRTGLQSRPLSTLSSTARAFSLPPESFSLDKVSSPIPSMPSQSIGTLGESAPPRPPTQSSPLSIGTPASARIMETSQNSPLNSTAILRAKLEASNARRRADRQSSATPALVRPSQNDGESENPDQRSQPSHASPAPPLSQVPKLVSSLIVDEQARRSPSSVPAVQPLPEITQEEMNTSERYETLVPRAEEAGSSEAQRSGSITRAGRVSRHSSVVEQPQVSCTYVVPIALLGHQRDQYQQTLYYQHTLIERFLDASTPDADLVAETEHFVDRMRKVTLHPDLDNEETLTQYDVEPKMQAQWDIDCSAKFRFLKKLLHGLRDQTLHVAIVAQPGRVVDMLAIFLTGITVPHRRSADITELSPASDHAGLMVTLLSVDEEFQRLQAAPADLVIAMDPAVSSDSIVVKALINTGGRRPPMITLVVPGTVEHIEYSISPLLGDGARLRTFVSGIYRHRNDAGKLEDDQLEPEMAADAIAHYLAAQDMNGEWPLATLGMLVDLDSQTDSDLEPTSTVTNASGTAGSFAAGLKRTFDSDELVDDVHDVSKKARYDLPAPGEVPELPMTINPQDIEITHVSDSVHKSTQLSASADAELAQQSSLLSDAEQQLQKLLAETQHRLEEHVQALSDLQYRHEDLRIQLVGVTKERDSAVATAQQAVSRMSENANKTSTVKAENTALKQRLGEAEARLLDHSVPERAEYEALRLAVAQGKAREEQLEKRQLSAKEENEYFRTNYQNASQTAQNLASQNTDLDNELAVLRNKATGEQAKLRQMGYDFQTNSLRDENKKLNARLKELEAALKFKNEENAMLKEASRGRMGTRGNSVPRSPRVGSPMKGRASRQGSPMKGRASRQGSPSFGEPKGKAGHLHPLRNG